MRRRTFLRSCGIGSASLAGMVSGAAGTVPVNAVLLEAEHFKEKGGWVVDQQFMDQMGSSFLLAHGLGVPVKDAAAAVTFPAKGRYRVWVRTRDWVGYWKKPGTPPTKRAEGSPGQFQVLVDGTPLKPIFGVEGEEWHWQDGGTVDIDKTRCTVALHDLTGFEGRCDGIFFTRDLKFRPPNEGAAMHAFRRKARGLPEEPKDAGTYELVVVGGGIAGVCAAVSGARQGLKVALLQDRPVVGGNNSSEVRVWLQGAKSSPRFSKLGTVLADLEQKKKAHYGPANTAELYEDQKKLDVIAAEDNLKFFPGYRVNDVKKDGNRIVSVTAQHIESGERISVQGTLFADCTGDGCVGFLAGADFEMHLDGHMGRCNLWHPVDTGAPQTFSRVPWALNLSDKPFPGRKGRSKGGKKQILSLGGWYWESGCYLDPFKKSEYIRDWNFRAMYGAWDALKNVDKVFPNHKLNWAAHISGKRESRRLLGDLVLSKAHLMSKKPFEDGCVITGWKIDLHLPHPAYIKGFEGDCFITKAHFTKYPTPFHIPYRCFYSRNIANLFMAGRDVSVTHEALGTVRVMRTGGLMGEVVGMAASLCVKHGCDSRAIYQTHWKEMQELMGYDGGWLGPGRSAKRPAPPANEDLQISNKCDMRTTLSNHKISKLPDELKGATTVLAGRGDASSPGRGYSFKVDKNVEVYLAVHDRGRTSPGAGWTRTDLRITWMGGEHSDTVYKKAFAPGIVSVPAHRGKEGANYGVPHMAFVKAADGNQSALTITQVKNK